MEKLSIKMSFVSETNETESLNLPKYSSGVINSASSYAHATRPENVGQVSEEIIEFRKDPNYPDHSLDDWKEWHLSKHGDGKGVQNAINETWKKFKQIRKSLNKVREKHIKEWMEDLVYNKTYNGLMVQKAIIRAIAEEMGKDWRLANAKEESEGKDGFINGNPLQIKPESYKEAGKKLYDQFEWPIVYYKKNNKKVEFEYDPDDFKYNPDDLK